MLREIEKKMQYCVEFKQENKYNPKVDKRFNSGEYEAYTDCKALLESVMEKIETSKGNILTNDDYDEGLEYAIKLLKGETE